MARSFSKYLFVGAVSSVLLSIIINSDAKISSYNFAKEVEADRALVAIDTPKTDEEIISMDIILALHSFINRTCLTFLIKIKIH